MIRFKQGTFRIGLILFLLALGQYCALDLHYAFAQPASFSPLVKKQRSKVVHIGIREKTDIQTEGHGLFPYWKPEPRRGMGSGVIISSDGLILTNHHVVSNTEFIEVVLENGGKYQAEIIGSDKQTDLALIRIDAKKLSVVEFGNSDKVEVGDWVIAIGNPWGLSFTVTAGIISAKGRNIFESDNLAFGEFIQTDAAINPGNSGGPLFNLKGKVIGVNTAISNKGYGIGFAVPSNLVVEVIRHLKEYGRVMHGWLGVVIAEITPELIRTLKLPKNTKGILIKVFIYSSPFSSCHRSFLP